MIDIIERPSETGKLINCNPQDWDSHQKIHDVLNSEKYVTASRGQYDVPRKYPLLAQLLRFGDLGPASFSTSSSRTMAVGVD